MDDSPKKPPTEPSKIQDDILLCSACRVLARLGYDFGENPALAKWWVQHQEKDAKDAL